MESLVLLGWVFLLFGVAVFVGYILNPNSELDTILLSIILYGIALMIFLASTIIERIPTC
jgi:multisubunit Na+/H+ antiporter MnhC subunit